MEDLQDREELRGAVRVVVITGRVRPGVFPSNREKTRLWLDGFEPIRTRLGVAYTDDCLEMGVTWRRDYETAGDARRGDTFQLFFSLKNLGFR